MKKLLPLLILTLFLASGSAGVVVQNDSTKRTLITESGTAYQRAVTEETKENGRSVFFVQSGE